MKLFLMTIFMTATLNAFSQGEAHFKVLPGLLHKKGTITAKIQADPSKYEVLLEYDVKKKSLVPIPGKLLKGSKSYEFPIEFKTVKGYEKLETQKEMSVPKAVIKFVKREDLGELKGAYFLQVLPKNGKSKIDITYHPSLPNLGWARVKITFINNIPVFNGYQMEAELVRKV